MNLADDFDTVLLHLLCRLTSSNWALNFDKFNKDSEYINNFHILYQFPVNFLSYLSSEQKNFRRKLPLKFFPPFHFDAISKLYNLAKNIFDPKVME